MAAWERKKKPHPLRLINLSHLYLFSAGFPAEQLEKKEILPINRPNKIKKGQQFIHRKKTEPILGRENDKLAPCQAESYHI